MRIYKTIKDFIFPNKCLSCEQIIIENIYFCYDCYGKLSLAKYLSKCEICSKPFQYSSDESVCIECKTSKIYYDKALYVYEYNLPAKQIITKLKFGDKTYLVKKIGQILVQNFLIELNNVDFITFVPMHGSKLRERFFNQSALIAKK